jgi:hypothetical protein
MGHFSRDLYGYTQMENGTNLEKHLILLFTYKQK